MNNTTIRPATKQEIEKQRQSQGLTPETDSQKPFVKLNFILMGVAMLMIILGFALMTGSANGDVPGFNEDIFSTRRIVIGPGIAFLGFLGMAFAIMYSPKQRTR